MMLQLEKGKEQSSITINGQVLNTLNGRFEVKDHDHELIERLYHSFKDLTETDTRDGSVVGEQYEENKIFELYKPLTENKEDIIGEYYHHFIQWTPVFRSAPDLSLRINMDQILLVKMIIQNCFQSFQHLSKAR